MRIDHLRVKKYNQPVQKKTDTIKENTFKIVQNMKTNLYRPFKPSFFYALIWNR